MSPDLPDHISLVYPLRDRQGQTPQCFWLAEDLLITLSFGLPIVIPKGFITDFASVPKFLWWLFPPIGDHNLADVIHDYLYTTNLIPRSEADKEFYYWMQKLRPLGRSRVDNILRYWAVRVFGRGPYKRKGQL